MRLGVIADIHGNLPALEATLDALADAGVDGIVCLGDLVGLLGEANAVVSRVHEACGTEATISGNHDVRVFPDRTYLPQRPSEGFEAEHVEDDLSEPNWSWLVSLPGMRMIEVDGTPITLAHCRPDPEAPWGARYGDAGVHPADFISVGGEHLGDSGGILLLGHTHYQHAVDLDKYDGQSGLVLNPGAVGFPYSDGVASFAIIETETQEFELATVEYDASSVQEFVRTMSTRQRS